MPVIVSNVHFEGTGNTRIEYTGSQGISTYTGNVCVFVSNSSFHDVCVYHLHSGSYGGTIDTLTDEANIAIDLSDSTFFQVTLAGNRNLDNPSNITEGQEGSIIVTQDATGGRSLTYSSAWKTVNDAAPSLYTGANKRTILNFIATNSTAVAIGT